MYGNILQDSGGSRTSIGYGDMRRGPLYMTAAGLVFTVMFALVKATREQLGAFDVVFWRGLAASVVSFALAYHGTGGIRVRHRSLLVVRTVLGFAAMSCSFAAAKGLGVGDLLLIAKMQPLLIAILAPVLLGEGERAGGWVWVMLAAGLAGGVLLVAPDLALGSSYGALALLGAVLAAGAKVGVRAIVREDDARVVVFYFQAGAMVLAAASLAVIEGRLPVLPPAELWPHLVGIGITAAVGQVLMTQAYYHDHAPVVAAATYTAPIWGVLADIAVFASAPDWNVLAGGLLILGAGMVLVFDVRPPWARRTGQASASPASGGPPSGAPTRASPRTSGIHSAADVDGES
jgi:drug/metabolite transporter (DMT)-like permease